MYPLYILSHLLFATAAPLFMAAMLPLSTVITLGIDKNWQHLQTNIKQPFFITALALSLALMLSCALSSAPTHSLEAAIKTSLLLLCFAYLWSAKSNSINTLSDDTKRNITLLFAGSILVIFSLNALIQQGVLDWDEFKLNRQLVVFALIFWPLSQHLAHQTSQKLILVTYALLVITLLTGFSETATLIFAGATLTYLFFYYLPGTGRLHTALLTLLLLTILFAPILIAAADPPVLKEFISTLPSSKQHHYQIWIDISQQILAHFPTGIGINTTRLFNFEAHLEHITRSIHHPHNMVMELLLELGALGAIIIALFISAMIYLFHSTPKPQQPALAATLVSIAIVYSVAFSVWQEWRTGAIAFALLLLKELNPKTPNDEITKNHAERMGQTPLNDHK